MGHKTVVRASGPANRLLRLLFPFFVMSIEDGRFVFKIPLCGIDKVLLLDDAQGGLCGVTEATKHLLNILQTSKDQRH